MRWWTEHEAREKRTDRTALLRRLCAWDPGWLCARPLTTILLKDGKLAQGTRPQPKKNRRTFAGALDTTRTGFLYQPSKFFASGLRRTFYLEKRSCSDVSSPRVRWMVSPASW